MNQLANGLAHRGIKKVRLRMRDLAVPGVPAAQPLKVAANQSRG